MSAIWQATIQGCRAKCVILGVLRVADITKRCLRHPRNRAFWPLHIWRVHDAPVTDSDRETIGRCSVLVLVMMLLIGLLAGVWGLLMCFFPARWDKLTEAIGVASRWTEPSPRRLHPLLRFGNRIGGLVILAVGCWFAYMAASEIYLVLTGRAANYRMPPASETLSSTPAPGITALSFLVVAAGILMAVFPAKALAVFGHIWPAGRSVTPSAAPKVTLVLRLCGVFFAALALMSLIH